MRRMISASQLRRALLAGTAAGVAVLAGGGASYASSAGQHQAAGLRMAHLTHIIRHSERYRLDEFLASTSGTLRSGAWGSLATYCPNGYMVTGGGASIAPPGGGLPRGIKNAYVTTSEAIPNDAKPPSAWLAVVTNNSGAPAAVSEQAICTRLSR